MEKVFAGAKDYLDISSSCGYEAIPFLRSHVILTLFLIELSLFFCGRILILLVLGDEIIHVGLRFCKLHLIHSFSCVPVQESFAPEHCRKVFCNTLEHLLNRGGVARKSDCHFQPLWWNVADARFDVVRNPLYE